MTGKLLHLENRAVIGVSGPERISFLQGLVTNDIDNVSADNAIYAGMLTPQGKFMFDMIIIKENENCLLLDVEAARKPDLMRRLMMYKLRTDVELVDDDRKVWALFDGSATTGISYPDPRHKALHQRVISAVAPVEAAAPLSLNEYEERRIRHGVPDGSRDIAVEKYFWLETNAEKLNGVSFTKGCYVGQELTARMKHRTTLKKKILPVKSTGGNLQAGATVKTGTGKKVGEILSTQGEYALAYLRLEFIEEKLSADGQEVTTNLKR